ncbi:methyltransferase [Lentzea sp. NBRC 105346]|uniref:class I SAM-dependent methyltransferase n=1 Tax=Lentzea sp. NBRC 105346 TaxID=3032205 RepID=UPI0024A0A34E|nr:class I SAM-dependent methyltransferase [Lentzea sp. NBRC 105346]GLZ34524.1 methyltransferase [Lentzea sp. NBRC 105346]
MRIVGGGASDVERLKRIQSSTDEFTRANILGLGLPASASCLELGAGAGGVAAWLGSEYESVLAVDIDTSALGSLPGNVKVLEADITAADFSPGEFDLVHCRFVLSHLPSRNEVVRRAASWLRPGGWLVLTEPFHLDTSASPSPAVARVLEAYWKFAVQGGADLRWSRQMPYQLASAGLTDIDFVARPGLLGGGARDRWHALLAPIADQLDVAQSDIDEVFALLKRDDFLDIPQVIIAAWGRRP